MVLSFRARRESFYHAARGDETAKAAEDGREKAVMLKNRISQA